MSAMAEEGEHAFKMLTPWEKELEILEDWLNNPEREDGFQKIVIPYGARRQPKELLE
jgi:hypothetical protein